MIKREMKVCNSKIFELEKRLPEAAQQFFKPLDDKLIMAYAIIDDVENQLDDVEDKVKQLMRDAGKHVEDTESDEDSEEEYAEVINLIHQQNDKVSINDPQAINDEISQNLEEGKVSQTQSDSRASSPKKDKSRRSKKKKRADRKKTRLMLANALAGGSNDGFKTEIENRLTYIEEKLKEARYNINDPFNNEAHDKIVVSYNEFEDKKAEGHLFDQDSEGQNRIDISKFELEEIGKKISYYFIFPNRNEKAA